jgi:hypothetical protein
MTFVRVIDAFSGTIDHNSKNSGDLNILLQILSTLSSYRPRSLQGKLVKNIQVPAIILSYGPRKTAIIAQLGVYLVYGTIEKCPFY